MYIYTHITIDSVSLPIESIEISVLDTIHNNLTDTNDDRAAYVVTLSTDIIVDYLPLSAVDGIYIDGIRK